MTEFEEMAEIAQLRRIRAKFDAQRGSAGAPGDPGPLLDWIPDTYPSLARPDHHAALTNAVERSLHGPVRFAYSAPVRHGKTTTTVCAIVWLLSAYMLLGLGPPAIAFVTFSHQRAKEVARMIWQFARDAGHVFPLKGTVLEKFTSTGGRVKCGGVFAAWTGDGYTHIFLDDVHANRQKAESPDQRNTLIAALDSDIYTREDIRGTSIFLSQARWNTEDAIAAAQRKPVPFEYVNRPAIVTMTDGTEVALAPHHMSLERLRGIREEVGKYVWTSLYQGEPAPREGALFKDARPERILPGVRTRVAIGIDLARTARTRSDHQALVVMRRHLATGPKLFDIPEALSMLGTIADRMRPSDGGRELVDAGFARLLYGVCVRHPGAVVVMYASAGEEWLIDLLVTQLVEIAGGVAKWRSLGIVVKALKIESRDKYNRVQAYAAAWNTQRVIVLSTPTNTKGEPVWPQEREREAWQERFIEQHRNFTGLPGGTDDWVDAATAAFDELDADAPAPDRGSLTTGVRSESESYGVDRI